MPPIKLLDGIPKSAVWYRAGGGAFTEPLEQLGWTHFIKKWLSLPMSVDHRSLTSPSFFPLWCFRKWMESLSALQPQPPPSFTYHHIILWIGVSSVCLLPPPSVMKKIIMIGSRGEAEEFRGWFFKTDEKANKKRVGHVRVVNGSAVERKKASRRWSHFSVWDAIWWRLRQTGQHG